jgi:hypothetical protein
MMLQFCYLLRQTIHFSLQPMDMFCNITGLYKPFKLVWRDPPACLPVFGSFALDHTFAQPATHHLNTAGNAKFTESR